jgi:hypothetical protein
MRSCSLTKRRVIADCPPRAKTNSADPAARVCVTRVGRKKPGFLRIAPRACTVRYLEDVRFGKSFRNRVSRYKGENRVSGEAFVNAGAALRAASHSLPRSSHGDPVFEHRHFRCTPGRRGVTVTSGQRGGSLGGRLDVDVVPLHGLVHRFDPQHHVAALEQPHCAGRL